MQAQKGVRDFQIRKISESKDERLIYQFDIIDRKLDAAFNMLMGVLLLLMVVQYDENWSLWLAFSD